VKLLPIFDGYENGVAVRKAVDHMPPAFGQTASWWRGWYDEDARQAIDGRSSLVHPAQKPSD